MDLPVHIWLACRGRNRRVSRGGIPGLLARRQGTARSVAFRVPIIFLLVIYLEESCLELTVQHRSLRWLVSELLFSLFFAVLACKY